MAQRINILRPEPDPMRVGVQQVQRSEPEALSPKRMVVAIFRARRFLILLAVIGAVVGVFSGISQPNVYRSEGQFLVKRSGSESLNLDPMSNTDDPFQQFQVRNNAPAILTSPLVLRAAAEKLGPNVILAPYQPVYVAETSIFRKFKNWILRLQAYLHSGEGVKFTVDAAMIRLEENITIQATGRNDLVGVSYTANDPERAQHILEVYMSVAREEHLKIYSTAEDAELIRSNLALAKSKLTMAKSRMDGLLKTLQIQDFASAYEETKEAHRTAENQMQSLERQIQYNENRLRTLKELQKTTPPTHEKQTQVETVDPGIAILEQSIADTQREIDQYLVTLKPTDSKIRGLKSLIETKRKRIEALKKLPPKRHMTYETVANPEFQQNRDTIRRLESDLELDRINVVAAQTRERQLRTELQALGMHSQRHRDLQNELTKAQAEYDRAAHLSDIIDKKSRLESKSLSSLTEVAPASLPLQKVGPRRGRILMLSILGFIGVGFMIVILLALTDKTVRSPEDLESALGIQTLAIIPLIDRKNIRRHKQLRASSWN